MSTPIGLGIPDGPPPVLHPRRKTRQLQVGPVGVGSCLLYTSPSPRDS